VAARADRARALCLTPSQSWGAPYAEHLRSLEAAAKKAEEATSATGKGRAKKGRKR